MDTNSVPNTLYPPPLYYHHVRREERGGGRSPPEEHLSFCRQNQRSSVYDAMATTLHWKAIVTPSSSSGPLQPTNESPDKEAKEGPSSKERLQVLVGLAREILDATTPAAKNKKTKRRHNRDIAAGHCRANSKEFVRDCCVTKGTSNRHSKTASVKAIHTLAMKAQVNKAPTFHSPACTTGHMHGGKTTSNRSENTPTRDGKTRLVVHVPRAAAARTRKGHHGMGDTATRVGTKEKVLASDSAPTPQYGHTADGDNDRPSKDVRTLMDELDPPDFTQTITIPHAGRNMEAALSHSDTRYPGSIVYTGQTLQKGSSLQEKPKNAGNEKPEDGLLEDKEKAGDSLLLDREKAEDSLSLDDEKAGDELLLTGDNSLSAGEEDTCLTNMEEVSNTAGLEATSSKAESVLSTADRNSSGMEAGKTADCDVPVENSPPISVRKDPGSESEWDSYSDDFVSESLSSESEN